jgi:23S rRNA (uridine2552-2'-O)-methyltransferase
MGLNLVSLRMRLAEAKRDHYRKLARELGYRSRAAFKLIQADKKYHIFKRGQKVVDFGSAPGGWLQVASERVGAEGLVVGVDMRKVDYQSKNVLTIQANIYDKDIAQMLLDVCREGYDVLLSDLAPNTSGIWELDHSRQIDMCERVLELSFFILKKGGSLFIKLFDGERLSDILKKLNSTFNFVSLTKPDASRKESSEVYAYCGGFRPGLEASLTAERTSL